MVTVCNTLQRATNDYTAFTQERRGLAPEMHPPPIPGPLKAGIHAPLSAEQEFRWDHGGLSWEAQGGVHFCWWKSALSNIAELPAALNARLDVTNDVVP